MADEKSLGMENNMKKRKIIFCCMLAVVLASLCSCASKKSAKKSEDEATVIIDKDNTVSVTYTEEFKEDYYDKDELEAQVDREIEDFNSSYAEDKANGMSKQSLKLKDKKITLKLKFASYKDYEAYSAHYVSITKNVKLFAGTYEDAVAAGYDLTNKVIDLDKKPEVKLDEKSDKKSEKDTEDTVSKDAEEATTDENSNETESTDETLEQTGEETSENSEGASTEQTDESESTSEEKSENSYEYKTVDEIKAIENVYVFYTNEGLDVKLPGKIVAAGEYVKVEKNTVITADGKDNYVIYKVKK